MPENKKKNKKKKKRKSGEAKERKEKMEIVWWGVRAHYIIVGIIARKSN